MPNLQIKQLALDCLKYCAEWQKKHGKPLIPHYEIVSSMRKDGVCSSGAWFVQCLEYAEDEDWIEQRCEDNDYPQHGIGALWIEPKGWKKLDEINLRAGDGALAGFSEPKSIKEWAEVFNISESTAGRWLRDGKLSCKKSGGRWRVANFELPDRTDGGDITGTIKSRQLTSNRVKQRHGQNA